MLANLYRPDGAYFVVAWNKLYRRELFEQIRYPLGRIHEDEATTYRIYDQVRQAAYVDRSLYGYFVTPVSITRGFNPRRMDWVTAVAERIDFFEEKGYRELMVPGLQALADGSIDIYFGMRDQLSGSEEQQENSSDIDSARPAPGAALRQVSASHGDRLPAVSGLSWNLSKAFESGEE